MKHRFEKDFAGPLVVVAVGLVFWVIVVWAMS